MAILRCYVDDRTMHILEREAAVRGRTVEELARGCNRKRSDDGRTSLKQRARRAESFHPYRGRRGMTSFRASGKQLLRCQPDKPPEHVADCASTAWASRIAALMNLPDDLDRRAVKLRPTSRWGARQCEIIASGIRAGLHESDQA